MTEAMKATVEMKEEVGSSGGSTFRTGNWTKRTVVGMTDRRVVILTSLIECGLWGQRNSRKGSRLFIVWSSSKFDPFASPRQKSC